MRRVPISLVVLGLIVALGVGAWLLLRGTTSGESAEITLSRLSKRSSTRTYYARYGGTDQTNPADANDITIYNAPGVGIRVDFAQPLFPDEDAKQVDDTLKSGDVFILEAPSKRLLSCRTSRRSCRTVDGLELLSF